MSSKSPTQLSLEHLRGEGYHAEVVEKWNSFAKIRQDLWGFTDILAVKAGEVLAVQTTSAGNVAARVTKINTSPLVGIVREAGVRIVVHGWARRGGEWRLREVDCS